MCLITAYTSVDLLFIEQVIPINKDASWYKQPPIAHDMTRVLLNLGVSKS